MPKNKPSGDLGQVSIGPGILYLGPVGSTPTVDVGYVKGDATLTFKRETVDVRAGSPQIIVDRFASQEDCMFEFNGIEWDMDLLAKALGDGTTGLSDPNETLAFGGAPDFNKLAVRFVHEMPDGGCLILNMWKGVPSGEIAAALKVDEEHEFPMKFEAMDPGATDWGGNALANGQQLAQLVRVSP